MATDERVENLSTTFLRLRADLSAERLPVDEGFWNRLSSGELGSFRGEYLVSVHSFDSDWDVWEMHPEGDETVCLLAGSVTFVLEEGAGVHEVVLRERGAFAVVPKGTWHTAKVHEPSTVLFITPGEGTRNRKA